MYEALDVSQRAANVNYVNYRGRGRGGGADFRTRGGLLPHRFWWRLFAV